MTASVHRYFDRTFTLGQSLAWVWTAVFVGLLGAHFFRAGEYGIVACTGGVLFFLCARSAWKRYAVALFLAWGAVEWFHSAWFLALMRQHMGQPWARGFAILAAVGLLTGLAAMYTRKTAARMADEQREADALFRGIVFISVFLPLFYLRQGSPISFLLLERFFPATGSVQIFLASWYGAFIAGKLVDPKQSRNSRKLAWALFGCVFFGQFFPGFFGVDAMLLTGRLHVPIPAFIIYGPVFRDAFSMMPVIALIAALLAGSAWCSLLCYFGPFEALIANRKPVRPLPPPLAYALKYGRLFVLAGGVLVAFGLQRTGLEYMTVVSIAVVYALASLAIMASVSRRYGGMAHCTTVCPMGLLVNIFGKISPWRLRVSPERCDDCGACEKVCLYRAITPESRKAGKTLLRCSLCRDCISVCRNNALHVGCPGLSPKTSWKLFTGIAAVLHTLFLSVAMV